MAYEESLKSVSFDADSTLAGYTGVPGLPGSAAPNNGKAQYRFVKITGRHQVGLATAPTDVVVGVAQNKPQVEGQATTVGIFGISNVLSGGAIAPADNVTTDDQGRAVTTADGAAGLGVAVTSASAAGELVSVLLRVN